MTYDPAAIMQAVLAAGLIGFGTDHFRLRTEVAKIRAEFVTREQMRHFEEKIDRHFADLSAELRRLAEGLAELRGRSGG